MSQVLSSSVGEGSSSVVVADESCSWTVLGQELLDLLAALNTEVSWLVVSLVADSAPQAKKIIS